MASITVTWQPTDGFTPITCWPTDDLPQHVKGTAYWVNHETHPSGYYYKEPNQEPVLVEFINDAWYILHFSCTEQIYGTRSSYQVDPNNRNIGLGHWHENDPANPNNQITPTIQIQVTNLTEHRAPSLIISESGSEAHQPDTWGPEPDNPSAAPGPLYEALAATLDPIVSLQGSLPLDPPRQEIMSANATTTMPTNAPSNGGMRRVPPIIFDGTQCHAEDFWGQFRRFKLVNQSHDAMNVTFGLQSTSQIRQTASFPFHYPFSQKPMYDTIWQCYFVRYDLVAIHSLSCTICISEPPLLRYLVLGELRSLLT